MGKKGNPKGGKSRIEILPFDWKIEIAKQGA